MNKLTPQTIKLWVRHWLYRSAELSGSLAAAEKRMQTGKTILMYHRILPDEQWANYPIPSLALPVSVFRAQLAWLVRFADVMTVEKAIKMAMPTTRPIICLTFDDGYWDNWEVVAPVAAEYGVKCTFFLPTTPIANSQILWHDQAVLSWQQLAPMIQSETGVTNLENWLNVLKKMNLEQRLNQLSCISADANTAPFYRLMTPDQAAELAHQGHEIGSHTVTHPLLPQLNRQQLEQELGQSRHELQTWTGQLIEGIGYPNGDHSDLVIEVARQVGYHYGCQTQSGLNRPNTPPFQLFRYDVTPQKTMKANGSADLLAFRAHISAWRLPLHL